MNDLSVNKGQIYEFGKFALDPRERVLLADGQPVHLADKVFDTLLFLIRNNGRLLTKDEMMTSIWQESFVEEGNLAKNVSRLRKILNADGAQLIETVPRRGYRFTAEVAESNRGDELLIRRRLTIKLTETAAENVQSAAVGKGEVHSIAVLPFLPLDPHDADDVVGLGLTDALITQISRAGQIQVRPTSAILKYNDPGRDIAAAGRDLDVDAVLEGRFQRTASKFRLTTQLTLTHDGRSLWADVFDTELADIFAVQDVIAEKVMASLNKRLSDEAASRLRRRYTANAEAYSEYLSGRAVWNKRTVEAYQEAIGFYERAIEIDPNYALAYAGLADIYNLLPLYDGFTPRDSFPKAKAAALQALNIDPDLGEAHAALGLSMLHYDWNWAGAEASFRTAIRLNPTYSSAHQLLGVYLCRVDRIGESIAALKRARELDPVSPITATWLAEVLRYYGETQASIRLHCDTLRSNPDFYIAHYHLAFSYLDAGRLTDAEFHRERAVSLAHENSLTLSLQGILQHAAGDTAGVERTLQTLLNARHEKYISAVNIASVYAAKADAENTIAWLLTGVEDRDPNLTWIKFDKEFGFMKDDERFRDILRTIGLTNNDEARQSSATEESKRRQIPVGPILAIVTMFAAVAAYLLYWFLR